SGIHPYLHSFPTRRSSDLTLIVVQMSDRPIFEGDLRRVQIADALTFVSMIRGRGKLLLKQGRLERTLHWLDGEIIFANSNTPERSEEHTSELQSLAYLVCR